MISVLFLILNFILPHALPANISSEILNRDFSESKSSQAPSRIIQHPILQTDTLLSPIESMFIRITHRNYLRQIGYESLKNRGNATNIGLNMTPCYKLGPGDELIVYLTGAIENTFRVTVDKAGMIFIPGLGTINAAGLTLHNLEKSLNTLAKQKWSNVTISVSPGRIRGIQVYLTGEVANPGIYTLKSHTTLLDLIFLAGGILKTGSLRRIEIQHSNGDSLYIDLYPYILGGKAKLPYLKDGDIVTITTLKSVIAVDGCLHRKGIYETTKNTTLKKILNWAGVLPLAQDRAEIHRINSDSIIVFSVPVSEWNHTRLKPGDYVYVPFLKLQSGGYVFIKGNVKKEGYYTFKDGITLQHLISRAGGFLFPPYKDILVFRKDTFVKKVVEVTIEKSDSFYLREGDSVIILQADVISQKYPVIVNGYVKNPGALEWSKNLSVKEAILTSIPRKDADLNNITVYCSDSGKVIKLSKNTWEDFILSPGDIIYVPQDTSQQQQIRVFIKGKVKFPGVYMLKSGSTVKDLIQAAGGPSRNAYIEGAYIRRKIIAPFKDRAILNTTLYSITVSGNDSSNLIPDYLIKAIKGRTENIVPALPEIALLNDDTIVIPSFIPYVYVTGAVVKPYLLPFKPDLDIQTVLRNAPLHPNADRKNAFCISVNGQIHHDRVKAGDIVFIPFKEKRQKTVLKDLAVISTIIYQIAMAVFIIYQVSK